MKSDFSNVAASFADMPEREPFVCSFSGGKDSVLALSLACERGEAKGILHWSDGESDASVFHSQDLCIVRRQAECMEIPLWVARYAPWKHRTELLKTYRQLAGQGIKSIVFGDIYLEDSVKMQSILCGMAGLTPRYPLWKKGYAELMDEICNRRIRSVITRVNTAFLSDEWLGRIFDRETYDAFCKLDMDPFGERGEFHTTAVDGDVYRRELAYSVRQGPAQGGGVALRLSAHHRPDNLYRLIE